MTQGNLPQISLPSNVPSTITVEPTLTHQAPAEDLVTELFLFFGCINYSTQPFELPIDTSILTTVNMFFPEVDIFKTFCILWHIYLISHLLFFL